MSKQRLQLTWYNKDTALIPTETGKYGYMWVDPRDPRYCETHNLVFDERVEGSQTPKNDKFNYSKRADLKPQDDNLMILGESGDVLESLTHVPELTDKYVGKVKLVYIDPPFNTEKTFESYEDNLEHSIWLTLMRDRLLNLKRFLLRMERFGSISMSRRFIGCVSSWMKSSELATSSPKWSGNVRQARRVIPHISHLIRISFSSMHVSRISLLLMD